MLVLILAKILNGKSASADSIKVPRFIIVIDLSVCLIQHSGFKLTF